MKKFLLIALVLLLCGAGIGAYQWFKPHRTAEDEKPVAVFTADELYNQFVSNEAESNAKFLDKVIQVSGVVNSVSTNESQDLKIALATSDLLAEVSCIMKQGEKSEGIADGTNIVIKGICNGFNTDVELRQAVVSK